MSEDKSQSIDFLKSQIKSQLIDDGLWDEIMFETSGFAPNVNLQYELDRVLTAIKLGKSNLKLRLKDKNDKKKKFNLDIDRITNKIKKSNINKETLINIRSLAPEEPSFWKSCFSYQVDKRKEYVKHLTDILVLLLFFVLPCLLFGGLIVEGMVQKFGINFLGDTISGILIILFAFIIGKGFYSISTLRQFGKKVLEAIHNKTMKIVEVTM